MDSFSQTVPFHDLNDMDTSESGFGYHNVTDPNSSGSTKRLKTTTYVNTLVPFLISQIKNCAVLDSANIKYLNIRVSDITIVAKVSNVKITPNSIVYSLTDNTGEMEAIYWTSMNDKEEDEEMNYEIENQNLMNSHFNENNETEDNLEAMGKVEVGKFVRIFGSLINIENRAVLSILKIKCIEDFNEISFHLLQAMHAELFFQNGGKIAKIISNEEKEIKKEDELEDQNEIKGDSKIKEKRNMGSGLENYAESYDPSKPFDVLCDKIINIILDKNTDDGMHINELKSCLQNIDGDKIDEKLEFLMNEGHIYTTIDNEHFQAVKNDY